MEAAAKEGMSVDVVDPTEVRSAQDPEAEKLEEGEDQDPTAVMALEAVNAEEEDQGHVSEIIMIVVQRNQGPGSINAPAPEVLIRINLNQRALRRILKIKMVQEMLKMKLPITKWIWKMEILKTKIKKKLKMK